MQALGFHGNECFRYRVFNVYLKLITEPKKSLWVTYTCILIHSDWGMKIHKYSIFPLRFLASRAILYDSAVQKRNFKKTFAFFYRPPSWIVPTVHCTAVTDDSCMKDVSNCYSFQCQEKNIWHSKSLKTFRRWSFSDDFTDDEAQISLWKDKICGEHFKWVYFFSWIKEESGVLDT